MCTTRGSGKLANRSSTGISSGPPASRTSRTSLAARSPHPLLGHGTVHASLISGRPEESTIPERCTLTIERRTLPGETADEVQAEVTALIERCASRDPRFTARTRALLARDAFQVPETEPIVEAVPAGAARIDGRPRQPVGVS